MVRQEQKMGKERTSTDSGKAGAVDVQGRDRFLLKKSGSKSPHDEVSMPAAGPQVLPGLLPRVQGAGHLGCGHCQARSCISEGIS